VERYILRAESASVPALSIEARAPVPRNRNTPKGEGDCIVSAYFFFDVREILDPEATKQYRERVLETVAQYGGRYLALGGPFELLEGDWQPVIPVIIEFPSLEQAKAWYDSDIYRPLRDLRLNATRSCGVLIDGFAGASEA
jgi:uncharacterized protein (DUF1330 family)